MNRPVARPRTVLDVPGHSARKLRRALDGPADALMMDLEDGVLPRDDAKAAARAAIAEAVREQRPAKTLLIRVNEVDSPWFAADLRLAVELEVDGIVVPKMRSARELRATASALDELRAPAALGVWAIVESPAFLLAAERGDANSERLRALICGVVDFLLQVTPRAFLDPLGLDAAPVRERAAAIRQRILFAARALGCRAIDAIVTQAITDPALAAQEAERAREAGFDGAIVLHPAQIEAANAAFELSADEIATGLAALETGRRAAAASGTSALVNGRVVLPQHVKAAAHFLEGALLQP
jgi:citrate lyase subunit beta / citryl-CoA lyase